jgi:hypothetical protein
MMAWQELIAEGKYIAAPIPYEQAIDTRAADWATAELACEGSVVSV